MMFNKKSLIVLAFAAVAFWFAEGAIATHGGSAKKSIKWPTGSNLECTLGFEDATLTFLDGGDPRIELKSLETSPCTFSPDSGSPVQGEGDLDITAFGVTRSCKKVPGENKSIETFTQKCGGGNDTIGSVDFTTGTVLIGGAAGLTGRQCQDVFPKDELTDPEVGKSVMTLARRFFVGTKTCDETAGQGVDGSIVLRMCNGDLMGSAGNCVDAAGDPVTGQGELDQLNTFDLACQRNPVNLDCSSDPSGVVKGTINGADTDVTKIDLESVLCGDPPGPTEAPTNFAFDDFLPEVPDGIEDLKVTCHRCVNGQTILEDSDQLIITWDTEGVDLRRGGKFAEAKEGGSCEVNL